MTAFPGGNPTPSHIGRFAPSPDLQDVFQALDVPVPPVKASASYGAALGMLGAFLVLIAVAFAALLAFLAWLCVWHLRSAVISLEQGPYLIFHVPMALLGLLLLGFLLKPLFFRSRNRNRHVLTLKPQDEPVLFAFIAKLCVATQSHPPTTIEVDCAANAGARLRSVFGGALVLRLGLPLAAAMPVSQFAGVLAHEFGHFNQRHGMRGASLIRRLTFFFAQIVFQRDRLDQKLAQMRASRNGSANLVYYLAAALTEPARGLLWLAVVFGELLTCHALRRMEYEADHFAAHIAGTRDFVRTGQFLAFLDIASQQAWHDLQQTYQEHRLPDDLPQVIMANARQLSEYRDDILRSLEKGQTRWNDTHPCHNDRVRNVEKLGAAGRVTSTMSARILFGDFAGLCQRATTAFYVSVLGKEFNPQTVKLVPAAELVESRAAERQAFKALRRFFRGQLAQGRPILPESSAHSPPDNIEQALSDLRSARSEMLRLASDFANPAEQYEKAAATVAAAEAQLALSRLFPGNPRVKQVQRKALESLHINQKRLDQANQILNPFEQQGRRRLTAALQLLQCSALAEKLEADAASAPAKVAELMNTCATLRPHLDEFLSLRERAMAIRVFYSAHQPNAPFQPLVQRVLGTNQALGAVLEKLKTDLGTTAYPFAHGTAGVSLGEALVGQLPNLKDPFASHACAMATFDRFAAVLFRTLGELAGWAEKLETALGLEALPEPDTNDQKLAAAEKAQAARNTRRYWIGYSLRAAVGATLLSLLIWLSVSPPTLPAMSWGDAPAMPYRPASFGVVASATSFTQYQPLPPRGYSGPFPGQPGYPMPGQPNFGQRFRAGAQPGMPGYVPPPDQPPQPLNPRPHNPRPYAPPSYSQPNPYGGSGSYGGGRSPSGPAPGGHR